LKGATRRGLKRELAAIEDQDQREQLYRDLVANFTSGARPSTSILPEIDAVIDPFRDPEVDHAGHKIRSNGKKTEPRS
jgi:hypothetical protein